MKNAPSRVDPRGALKSSEGKNDTRARAGALFIPETTARAQSAPPNLITVFKERCEAQALMVAEGMLELQDAVDALQMAALDQGLIRYHGQDKIQQVMGDAFKCGGKPWTR